MATYRSKIVEMDRSKRIDGTFLCGKSFITSSNATTSTGELPLTLPVLVSDVHSFSHQRLMVAAGVIQTPRYTQGLTW